MNIRKVNGVPIACFTKSELGGLLINGQLPRLKQAMVEFDVSAIDLQRDWQIGNLQKIEELAGVVSKQMTNDRDEHELFTAWEILAPFYGEEVEICFELKNTFNHNKDSINTLDDLNKFRDDRIFGDFIIRTQEGYRGIQLKRYRGNLENAEIQKFIEKVLNEYGTGLGDTNLMILMQPIGDNMDDVDFAGIHELLVQLAPKIKGQIFFAFNANNSRSVVVEVFPDHKSGSMPINWRMGHPPKSTNE